MFRNSNMDPKKLAAALIQYLNCPCEYYPPMKDDALLLKAYHEARERGQKEGFVPMIIIVDDILWECLVMNTQEECNGIGEDSFDAGKVEQYRKSMLSAPVGDGKAILDEMAENYGDEAEEDGVDWEDEILGEMAEDEGNDRFLGYYSYASKMTEPLILAEIPVKNPWEVFAFLPFGGWNECPDTPELMAVAKYWFEKHGAIPAVITHDVLEFYLSEPVSEEQSMELAREQYGFCPDVVDQSDGLTVNAMAVILQKSNTWYFWWD